MGKKAGRQEGKEVSKSPVAVGNSGEDEKGVDSNYTPTTAETPTDGKFNLLNDEMKNECVKPEPSPVASPLPQLLTHEEHSNRRLTYLRQCINGEITVDECNRLISALPNHEPKPEQPKREYTPKPKPLTTKQQRELNRKAYYDSLGEFMGKVVLTG